MLGHPADIPYIRGYKRVSRSATLPYLRHPWYAVYVLHLLAKGVLGVRRSPRLDELADGEVLDVPGSPRVVRAPGHTAGSCALLLKRQSVLLSSDALVTLDMTRGQTGPQIIRGPVTEDADPALQSLDVLAATNAATVLPGHGDPWPHGVATAVRAARARG